MKLYYLFCACDNKDFEFDVERDVIIDYLESITSFNKDEISQHLPLFEQMYSNQIHKRFEKEAHRKFNKIPNLENTQIMAYLRKREILKRNRQAFFKREALKKKEVSDEKFRDS
jgi:hypothetical protein